MPFSSVLAASLHMPMPVAHNSGADSLGYTPALNNK